MALSSLLIIGKSEPRGKETWRKFDSLTGSLTPISVHSPDASTVSFWESLVMARSASDPFVIVTTICEDTVVSTS